MTIAPVQRVVAAAQCLVDVHVRQVQSAIQNRADTHGHIPRAARLTRRESATAPAATAKFHGAKTPSSREQHWRFHSPVDVAERAGWHGWRRWYRRRRRWRRERRRGRQGPCSARARSLFAKTVAARDVAVAIAQEHAAAPFAGPHPTRIVAEASEPTVRPASAFGARRLPLQRHLAPLRLAAACADSAQRDKRDGQQHHHTATCCSAAASCTSYYYPRRRLYGGAGG
jgi:hypothetical protein